MSLFRYNKIITWCREHPLLLFIVLHAVLFLVVSASLDGVTGGNNYERGFAEQILNGEIPFADFIPEYPPLALVTYTIPGLISTHLPWYGFLFAVMMFICDVVILWIMGKLSGCLNLNRWPVFGIYTLVLVSIGVVATGRFDLFPAMLVILSIYAFVKGKNKTAWLFLALGVSVKIYPIGIAPLFVLYLLGHREIKRLVQGLVVFGVTALAINLPWYFVSPAGFKEFLAYHLERGLHAESVYGSVLLTGKITSLITIDAGMTYGSWNLISPLADLLGKISLLVTGFGLALAYGVYSRLLWKNPFGSLPDELDTPRLIRFALLAVLIMLVTSKIFSPQYLLWLAPLAPLVFNRRFHWPLWLLIAAGALTQWVYPYHYLEFEMLTPYLVVMVLVRNVLLVVVALVLFARPREGKHLAAMKIG